MSLSHRLITSNRTLLNRRLQNNAFFIRPVTIKVSQYEPPKEVGYDEYNMALKRPQSPHLTIYSLQLTSVLSISHRITGMGLTGYAFLLGAGAVCTNDMVSAINNLHMTAACLYSIKFMIAFPFSYHFVNGIRHMVWDLGKFLTIKDVYTTGYIMVGLSTALTVGLCSI